jgi:hypothetical protein
MSTFIANVIATLISQKTAKLRKRNIRELLRQAATGM